MHGGHTYFTTGLDMRPGFHPPAGANSSDEIGGVTTQNLFVDTVTGQSNGKDYGATVRTIAVKPGDRVQLDVAPARANVNTIAETGGKEITGYLKYYYTRGNAQRLWGGIEVDYGDREEELLPSFSREELPTIVVPGDIPVDSIAGFSNPATHALRYKEPFLLATFQQKTERDSLFPSRSWLHNGVGNLYASAGLDQPEEFTHHQYEFQWEVMTDWPPNSPSIEISNTNNRGYGGAGIYAQSGTEFATFASLPVAPAHSLVQFRHAPLNAGGQLPLVSQVVGNSFAPPLLGRNQVRSAAGDRTYLDHSYLANNALFDSWFLSTAASRPQRSGLPAREARELLSAWFQGKDKLPNARFRPYLAPGEAAEELAQRMATSGDSYHHLASHLLVDAPFNVNSTSVAAWEAVLSANFSQPLPMADASLQEGEGVPILRHLPATGTTFETAGGDEAKWNGQRRLDQDQIHRLAQALVEEIQRRGPFLSLAEFVNRRPGNDDFSAAGALQSAIDRSGINDAVLDESRALGGAAGDGNSADGAPGVLTQADILSPLAPQLVVRGDTFRIRAYGQASGVDGKTIRAWCEATVQRLPPYVDAAGQPAAEPPTSKVNQTFGRRFELVAFRWLSPSEVLATSSSSAS